LKPSNILVRTDGEAKLLDFGIAKLLECGGKNAEAPLMLEGGGAMTPEYAAPEQLKLVAPAEFDAVAPTSDSKGYSDLLDLNWATDSQSMFVSTLQPGGVTLLHIGLNGDARPIGQQPRSPYAWGIPSPDGRHLALAGTSSESNVWMMGNF